MLEVSKTAENYSTFRLSCHFGRHLVFVCAGLRTRDQRKTITITCLFEACRLS